MAPFDVPHIRALHRNLEGQLLDSEGVLISNPRTMGAPAIVEIMTPVGKQPTEKHADLAAISYLSMTPQVVDANAYELGRIQSGRWGAHVPVQYYKI